jgi:hypothetical protein
MFKKFSALSLALVICLCLGVFSVSAASVNTSGANNNSANNDSNTPTSGVPSLDPNHAVGLYNTGTTSNQMNPMASGLISLVSLQVYRESGNTLLLEGQTVGTETLDKIGFQNISLQRWQNGEWENQKVWSTYEYNTASCVYEYSTTVTPGYSYRFIATHYAEKDFLIFPTVQTFYNETSYLDF